MAKILQKDIGVQNLQGGGRYFDLTLRDAKRRFLYDIKAGLV